MPVNDQSLLSANEAAELLGCSKNQVESLVARGVLEAQQRPGTIELMLSQQEVLRLLEAKEEAKSRGREFSKRLDQLGAPAE